MNITNTIRNVGLAGLALGAKSVYAVSEVGSEVVRNVAEQPVQDSSSVYGVLASAAVLGLATYISSLFPSDEGEDERRAEQRRQDLRVLAGIPKDR